MVSGGAPPNVGITESYRAAADASKAAGLDPVLPPVRLAPPGLPPTAGLLYHDSRGVIQDAGEAASERFTPDGLFELLWALRAIDRRGGLREIGATHCGHSERSAPANQRSRAATDIVGSPETPTRDERP